MSNVHFIVTFYYTYHLSHATIFSLCLSLSLSLSLARSLSLPICVSISLFPSLQCKVFCLKLLTMPIETMTICAVSILIAICNIYYTSLNPQNLRNIIKKVAKISIIQILMPNLSVKTTVFCYFLQLFRYPTNFTRLR